MKFALAFASAAAALRLSATKTHKPTALMQLQSAARELDLDYPDWVSDDPECAAVQGLLWSSFQLADMNNDGQVTVDELNNGVAFLMSIQPSDVAELYDMAAVAGDEDASSISDADLVVACEWLQANAGMDANDCIAIEIMMFLADKYAGDGDGLYELEEIQAGIAEVQAGLAAAGEAGLTPAMAVDFVD